MKSANDTIVAGSNIKPSHTPGPWHRGGVFFPDSKHPTTSIWGPTPQGMQSGNIVCEKTNLADANLIATAPDLLELAQQWAKECAECNGTGFAFPDGEDCLDCKFIRDVIDKAVA